ncbi:MAG: tetratricopeptide repeat protein [Cyclobacteriaceae bacterium]
MEPDLELIEKYLAGELSEAEKENTELRLQKDETFAHRLELTKNMKGALLPDVEGFKGDLKEVFEEYDSEKTLEGTSNPFFKGPYLIAASVVLLLGVSVIYLLLFQSQSPQQLYAANFSVPAENISVRNDSEVNDDLQKALKAYNEANYSEALSYFDKVGSSEPQSEAVIFYSGICYMMLDQPDEAIINLERVLENESSSYATTAQWYLGLSLLQKEDATGAKKIFEELVLKNGSNYAKKAEIILKQLD